MMAIIAFFPSEPNAVLGINISVEKLLLFEVYCMK